MSSRIRQCVSQTPKTGEFRGGTPSSKLTLGRPLVFNYTWHRLQRVNDVKEMADCKQVASANF